MDRSKDEAFEAFKKLKAATEMEQVHALWTYCGEEYALNEFDDYRGKIGIKRFLMAPYMPQQNGVVEVIERSLTCREVCSRARTCRGPFGEKLS